MYQMPYASDPLTQYHTLLRISAQSGYPNSQYANPHPYEIAYDQAIMRPKRYPFRYNLGRSRTTQIKASPTRSPIADYGTLRTPVRSLYNANIMPRR